ncbi:hypothetical protein DFA_10856 [Cavenderia fasciculata]|uniref:Leucine-rich repeat-containing protein n=1 Tax=Cavenderia fasciculata TaxID=261658 RepID=F4QBL0_CACFS|nr:uncharacterized protein DFA_10856 [Cavenderia fasciculata]EGG14598.1 hypothetical protein DFA_10856 [Cavenderia fasciculata]|eukprot:XP_004351106.1 hypothetical protein DFA_10856 [Cavenderia fasciculata]
MTMDTLALPGQDFERIPVDVLQTKAHITSLDLSYNNIKKVENIGNLTKLSTLVLDNNQLGSKNDFPSLPSLNILSVNNNNIDDLKVFIDSIKDKFPNLTHLSLLKNPACPSYYVSGTDYSDYQKYRYYVLFHLKNLKFLDISPVMADEVKEAQRQGLYSLVARPVSQDALPEEEEEHFNGLSQELTQEGKGKAGFSVSNYVYYGKQSEGNRFIMNDDL